MKVSIDVRHAGLPGIGRFSTELAAGLVRRGTPGDQIVSLRRARPGGWLGAESLRAESLSAAPSAAGGRAVTVFSPTVGPLEQLELAILLRLHRVDLHHSTHLSLPRLAGLPVVLTVHDLFPLTESGHARSDVAGAYYRAALPWAVKHADAVVAVSRYTAERLEEVLGRRADAVIGHGVDHSAWRGAALPCRTPERPYLLYVGTAKPHKNLATLLAAHAGARDGRGEPLPPLILAGPTATELKALGLAGSDTVSVLGRVPDRDLPSLFAGAAAVAVPSLYEGFGLTALEAMAHGVPVVAADSPGLRDTVGDAAALVPATEPAAWADALARCSGDPLVRRTLVERGRAHAARFRWDDSADRYLALYRQILGR